MNVKETSALTNAKKCMSPEGTKIANPAKAGF
jgi:hypothetical protein